MIECVSVPDSAEMSFSLPMGGAVGQEFLSRDDFESFVSQYADRLHSVATRYLRSTEDAADAVQDALLSAYKSAATVPGAVHRVHMAVSDCRKRVPHEGPREATQEEPCWQRCPLSISGFFRRWRYVGRAGKRDCRESRDDARTPRQNRRTPQRVSRGPFTSRPGRTGNPRNRPKASCLVRRHQDAHLSSPTSVAGAPGEGRLRKRTTSRPLRSLAIGLENVASVGRSSCLIDFESVRSKCFDTASY
jgi:hypothetical protein